MTKWFYQTNQIIKGPVSTLELQKLIPAMQDLRNTFVWSRGHSDWISADRWQPDLEIKQDTPIQEKTQPLNTQTFSQLTSEKPNFNTIIPLNEEKTNVINTNIESEKFRVQLNFIDQPPMSKDELMAFAARTEDPAQIAIYDNQTKEWKEIYAFKDIVEKLGLTRRKHPRVPILAQFTGSTSTTSLYS